MEQKNILILYHSGAGSTQTIAEVYGHLLSGFHTELLPVTDRITNEQLEQADLLIFAFPTYHVEPSTSMRQFLRDIPKLGRRVPVFVFTTYGLYAENALRIFIKEAQSKNMITVGYADYRAPATDGVLMLPPFRFMFCYEKRIARNILQGIAQIQKILLSENPVKECIPPVKWYTLLNAPNRYFGKKRRVSIKVLKEACIQCNLCVKSCPNNCWSNDAEKYPVFNSSHCESCYRCVHHCPKQALILSPETVHKKKLNPNFYQAWKEHILQECLEIQAENMNKTVH